MRVQGSRKTIACLGLGCMVLFTSSCAEPTETERYARELDLPKEVRTIVQELEYDDNAKSLLDKLCYLPEELQAHEVTLDYVRDVAKDKKVSDEEYRVLYCDELDHDGDGIDLATEKRLGTDPLNPDPELRYALDSLESVSGETLEAYLDIGIDDHVVEYISFVLSLPQDFAEYALESKLCIQDKELTELERSFLEEPDEYLQQMYDYYMSEIGEVDSNLARELKELPYFEEIEVEDMEVLEDVLYLASNADNKAVLEKLYGKEIERKMHSVALEALVWRGMRDSNNEFDSDNPLEGPDRKTLIRLAKFQEKYNREMDIEGVESPKPTVRGISYTEEPQGWIIKNEYDLRFDYGLMRWALRCNAVRLWGYDDNAFYHVKLAQNEGLEVYLQFEPIVPCEIKNIDIDLDSYKERLSNFATRAEKNDIKFLFIGNELELWWKEFGSKGLWGWTSASFDSRETGKLEKLLDELTRITRENYSGSVTYADWWASPWGFKELDWSAMDIVSRNMIMKEIDDSAFLDYLTRIKSRYSKPFIISEIGSLTITEAELAGGDDSYLWAFPVHHDQEKQAEVIDRRLKLAYQAGVDGVFILCWDRSTWNNMNELGFGIWDHVKKEPKLSFWTVYRYFKE